MVVSIKLFEQMGKNNIRTVRELQERSGISLSVLHAIMRGKSNVRLFTIVRLCEVFKCDIQDLVVLNEVK